MSVQVVRDHDPTHAGDDFLRVYCQRREGSPAVFATIERVFGRELRTGTWIFRTLVSGVPLAPELATRIAEAYAERKNIPVVYVEVDERADNA
jgi:hypothetical protein